jgi:hypothetical protein
MNSIERLATLHCVVFSRIRVIDSHTHTHTVLNNN